ncbi:MULTISPECIES: BNR repeat-containing protein [Chitinophagaceae]
MTCTYAQDVRKLPIDKAWAGNSVNVTVFRKNSVVSWRQHQYAAFYDQNGYVKIAKRNWNDKKWSIFTTDLKGDVRDAHKVISMVVDGDGYMHLCWNEHNSPLHYVKSVQPEMVQFGPEIQMTGINETKVTYPEFYRLSDGNLLFFYRDGGSGNGNMVINRYDLATKKWTNIHKNLIDGEGNRNAYWQACTDNAGNIYLSWVWRESPDVASNHDMCFAMSSDGGRNWKKSDGELYSLPITASTAEYICHIPEKSSLINQTSMVAMSGRNEKNILIASYWKDTLADVPQYHVLYFDNGKWSVSALNYKKEPFTLGGYGTKNIPMSRPQIVATKHRGKLSVTLIFRDEERGNRVSIATNKDMRFPKWTIKDMDETNVGAWEPTYDTELWKMRHQLDLFVQPVVQVDGEGLANRPPTMAAVWELFFKKK